MAAVWRTRLNLLLRGLVDFKTEPHLTVMGWVKILGTKIAENPWKSAAAFGLIGGGVVAPEVFDENSLITLYNMVIEAGESWADLNRSAAELNRHSIELH